MRNSPAASSLRKSLEPDERTKLLIPQNSLEGVVDSRSSLEPYYTNNKPPKIQMLPPPSPRPSKPTKTPSIRSVTTDDNREKGNNAQKNDPLLIVIYGLINTIMCIPCIYGYASVIFNNDAFQPDINALSKLVLFSSIVHQICFTTFSSLPFSIGQVQDAGLIFLSAMANRIANTMMEQGATREELVSTTIVILGVATSSLGVVLVLMGKFRLADMVSYLPLPVVGGYLAFIGYFCVMAGVALCIDKAMVELSDWAYLLQPNLLILAIPGLLAGMLILLVSRYSTNDAALPLVMVALPVGFFVGVYVTGFGMEPAREEGWLGPHSPPIPAQDVFALIKLSAVDWSFIMDCLPTWAGMVFVVSFSSCLDVAAISMDMGEALDVNKELMTVGFSNCASGLTCGFTGSYIFSQTIFTYRTGVRSRWIGVFLAVAELVVFMMTVNVLEVTPLFFLGATLIFIGFDLLYEWLIEVRHKLLLSEYGVLVATFIAIHVAGIDGGIVVGIMFAGLDYVVTTAKASSVNQVERRSRAVWNQEQWRFLQQQCYEQANPKIVTFEVTGSVFFGSSLQVLTAMTQQIGIKTMAEDREAMSQVMATPNHFRSPRPSPSPSSKTKVACAPNGSTSGDNSSIVEQRALTPELVVLDFSQMQNLDASAARGCFLQLAKMCSKRGVVVCAAGASIRVDWMLRSHNVAYDLGEEEDVKQRLLGSTSRTAALDLSKIILFETIYEALEFCETCLLERMDSGSSLYQPMPSAVSKGPSSLLSRYTLSAVFNQYLGLEEKETKLLEDFASNGRTFHDELELNSGDAIFAEGQPSDAFYIILAGSVALHRKEQSSRALAAARPEMPLKSQSTRGSYGQDNILSGAGLLSHSLKRHSFQEKTGDFGSIKKYLQLGAIFGFVDFVLDQTRRFGAVANGKTIVARIHREGLNKLKAENPELQRIVDKVLLQVSVRELANVTDP